MKSVSRVEIYWFDSREEAIEAEAAAINLEEPIYNIKLEPIHYDKWLLFSFCNKQWPFDGSIKNE
jgi:hypothetical protein